MKTTNKLPVSEVFYSLQGEGRTMGKPAVFLRLGGCNLLCQSPSWICDTIEVWRKSKATNFEDVLTDEHVSNLASGASLVITGGEPLLHQFNILAYLTWFVERYHFNPYVEVETNGTIKPHDKLDCYITQYNCSPKLSSAGEQNKLEMRFNPEAIGYINFRKNTLFKFVVSNEEDVKEMQEVFVTTGRIDLQKVCLMPAGATQEELAVTRPIVAELCKKYGYRYSERLHVVIWNKKTGV